MIPRASRSTRRARRAAALSALLLGTFTACRAPGDDAASGREDPRESALVQARRVLGERVRDAVPVAGPDGRTRYLAALLVEGDSFPEARTVALLEGGPGAWRVRRRHRTLLPVPDSSGTLPFGTVDADGDGAEEVYVTGSAWNFVGATVGVDVIRPGGPAHRYGLTADRETGAAHAVWTPGAEREPAVLGWMAARAQGQLGETVRVREARLATTSFGGGGEWRLTREQAMERARQRLGWSVREAHPFDAIHGYQSIAVLASSEWSTARALLLWGSGHVYTVRHEIPLRPTHVIEREGNFGLVDVDRDGRPEVFTVGTESGSSGEHSVIVGLFEPETERASEYRLTGFEGGPELTVESDARVDSLPGARRWMDSVARHVNAEAFGPPRRPSAPEARAVAAESAWAAANPPMLEVPRSPAGAWRRGPPRPDSAVCAVPDGGVTWLSYRRRGVWAHDRAGDRSRVVYAPAWMGAWATSLVVGRRYVWTNVMRQDSGAAPALLAFDKARGVLEPVPIPSLRDVPGNECAGACRKRAGEPLRVEDGNLVLEGVPLDLPPGIDAVRELAGARSCWAGP